MNDAASESGQQRKTSPVDDERAVVLDLDVAWDGVDPDPHLLTNGRRAFLAIRENRPSGNPTGRPIWGDQIPFVARPLAVVVFLGFHAVRAFGGPGTETLNTHHLHGKGLQPYRAHRVLNSQWLAYEEHVDALNPAFIGRPKAELSDVLVHYLFSFSEHTLEFLAEDISLERRDTTLSEMITELGRRLVLT